MERLNEKSTNRTLITTNIYNMSINIAYEPIKIRMEELYQSL